ncbi:MAG: phospholipase D-like domain-containing protein [Alicyclobacillaceae bacterium]|nr:phospholipase D-like domain-containing protein [Alicyclobacillaceae bacterium]
MMRRNTERSKKPHLKISAIAVGLLATTFGVAMIPVATAEAAPMPPAAPGVGPGPSGPLLPPGPGPIMPPGIQNTHSFPTAMATPGTRLIIEPMAGPTPFVHAIDKATKSIDVEMYLVTDHKVERALIAAAKRGVRVRVILDKEPEGLTGDAIKAYQLFTSHGIPVHYAPSRFTFDHAKTMVVDDKIAFVGSANFTYYGLDKNREYDVETSNPAVVQAVADVFRADWANQRAGMKPRRTLVLSPMSQSDFLSLIAHAKRILDMEEEESPNPAISHALIQAAKRGVHVTLLEADTSSNRSGVGAYILSELASKGVTVKIVEHPYLHAKLVISDNDVFIGSENFSTTSLKDNREVGVIWKNPSFLPTLNRQFAADNQAGKSVPTTLPSISKTTLLDVLKNPVQHRFVQLTGTVEARFGSTAFISSEQDGYAGGMELWLGSVNARHLKVGDRVSVTGYINTFEGQLEIEAVQTPTVLGSGWIPAPANVSLSQLTDRDGLLVKVRGVLSEKQGTWYLQEGSDRVPIVSLTPSQSFAGWKSGMKWSALAMDVISHGSYSLSPVLVYNPNSYEPIGKVTAAKVVSLSTLVNNVGAYLHHDVQIQDGVVSAVYSGGSNLYLEAGDKGMRVYLPADIKIPVQAGDELDVSGTVSMYDGTPEIDPTLKPTIVGHIAAPAPIAISVSQVSDAYLEGYVSLHGTVSHVTDETFQLSDSTGTISIYEPSGTLPTAGQTVTVAGVVTLYKGHYQIETSNVTQG